VLPIFPEHDLCLSGREVFEYQDIFWSGVRE
jgi:hypothetical protein